MKNAEKEEKDLKLNKAAIKLVLLMIFSLVSGILLAQEPFTLEKCLSLAHQNNHLSKSYRKEIEKSRERVLASRSSCNILSVRCV